MEIGSLLDVSVNRLAPKSPIGGAQPDSGESGCVDGTRVTETIGALEELVAGHGLRVQHFCGRMTNWHADAMDLAQDVFVVAIERQGTFRGDSSVETWLLGIAVRVCRKWIRREAIRRRVFGWMVTQSDSTGPDPAKACDAKDQVSMGLQSLDVQHREVLVLRYMENRDIEQIATVLKISRQSVDQRLTRARRKLGEWLERQA
jgi:RNA polymerase sigma-70 factor, ECF subfamily